MKPEALAEALTRPRRLVGDLPQPDARLSLRGIDLALHFRGPAGAARRALLVHGWETDHRDLETIAGALAGAGLLCVLPDLPAHGGSTGDTMTLPEGADALAAVDEVHGPFALCVGHSVGSAVALIGLTEGLRAETAALLAPPRNYVQQLSTSARVAGAPAPLIAAALQVLRTRCPSLDGIDSLAMAPRLTMPGLVAVAGRDQVLDPQDGRLLAGAWPGCRLLDLPEASHRSILRDAAVVEAIGALAG